METKEQLIKLIKEWVTIDNEIRVLQKEQTSRKTEKINISKKLMEVMQKNDIDCFDINDGKIMYSKKNIKKPINKTMLLSILSNFYKGDNEKVDELHTYIMENRENVVKESIVRKIHINKYPLETGSENGN